MMIFGSTDLAMRVISRMSTNVRVGFDGVSIHTALVSSLINAFSISAFDKLAKVVCKPLCFATFVIYRCVPPYTSCELTICPPLKLSRIAAVTALPLANARPYLALSRAATAISNRSRVSLPLREYSYFDVPISLCANVVEMPIGAMTALVAGSGWEPVCIAVVANEYSLATISGDDILADEDCRTRR